MQCLRMRTNPMTSESMFWGQVAHPYGLLQLSCSRPCAWSRREECWIMFSEQRWSWVSSVPLVIRLRSRRLCSDFKSRKFWSPAEYRNQGGLLEDMFVTSCASFESTNNSTISTPKTLRSLFHARDQDLPYALQKSTCWVFQTEDFSCEDFRKCWHLW